MKSRILKSSSSPLAALPTTMKALAHRGTPAAPDARPNARAASQSRLLRELLRGDGADHAKALLLFDGMVAAADVTLESVHLVLQACADEKAATSILASAAEANATPTAATWRLLAAKWLVVGDAAAAGRANARLTTLGEHAEAIAAPQLARKRALWLRRLVARKEASLVVKTLSAYAASGEASPPMLLAVKRAAASDPSLRARLDCGSAPLRAALAAVDAENSPPIPRADAADAAGAPKLPEDAAAEAPATPTKADDDAAAAAAERARQVELLRSRRLEHPGEDDERSTCTHAIERDIRGSPQ